MGQSWRGWGECFPIPRRETGLKKGFALQKTNPRQAEKRPNRSQTAGMCSGRVQYGARKIYDHLFCSTTIEFKKTMKIAVASEHRGFKAKDRILAEVRQLQHEALDFGPATDEMCDYPDFAAKAARAVACGEVDRAILIGGTGIGMNIVANKFPGVRAALCHDDLSAQISRSHNDSNVLCLSINLFGAEVAPRIIKIWLETPFEGGRHARRVSKIAKLDEARQNHSTQQ